MAVHSPVDDRSAPDPGWSRWQQLVAEVRAGAPISFDSQWRRFREIDAERARGAGPLPAWKPDREQLTRSNLGRLMAERGFADYNELHAWSITHRDAFWGHVIRRLGIVFATGPESTVDLAEGVTRPRWLPGAELNCADSCFTAPAGRAAIVAGSETTTDLTTTTYGELERLVNRFASGLRQAGIEPGAGVALYMPMNLECVVAYLGTVRAGCYVVSIADSFAPAEVANRLAIGGARVLVTVDRFQRAGKTLPLYERALEGGAPRVIVVPGTRGAAPADGTAAPVLRAGDLTWNDFLGSEESFDSVAGDPDRMTNVLFSSGTTGTPKAIPWTHMTPIKCAMDGHLHHDIRPGDVVAWPTNIGWMMGPWLIYASLINKATIALHEGVPTGARFARFVQDTGVTMLGVVPSLVRGWRDSGSCDGADWSGVRVFSSTGEASNRRDYLWLMSLAGYRAPVIEYCGGTEIGGGYVTGTVAQPASPATFTTAALGLELVILAEDGSPAKPGEMGEAFLVPPSIGLSQTLLNRDHDQVYHAGCPRGPAGEVLRRHGDQLARLDEGSYRAQGRADDTMNLGGIKVSSLELERALNAHPSVFETAAVAVQPEGEGAERLVVYAVPRETATVDARALARELQDGIAGRLNPLFRIHDVVLVDSLPRTASNKLMRRTLRSRYLEENRS